MQPWGNEYAKNWNELGRGLCIGLQSTGTLISALGDPEQRTQLKHARLLTHTYIVLFQHLRLWWFVMQQQKAWTLRECIQIFSTLRHHSAKTNWMWKLVISLWWSSIIPDTEVLCQQENLIIPADYFNKIYSYKLKLIKLILIQYLVYVRLWGIIWGIFFSLYRTKEFHCRKTTGLTNRHFLKRLHFGCFKNVTVGREQKSRIVQG